MHLLYPARSRFNKKSFKSNVQSSYLGGILILVAFINAGIEFYQIQKSEAILASFLAMIPPLCRVIREGRIRSIPAADLVNGDVVLLVRHIHLIACKAMIIGTRLVECSVAEIKLQLTFSCSPQPISKSTIAL